MPKLQSKLFKVVEAPHPNGRCKFYTFGYPKGKRERYWFRTKAEAKQDAADRNAEIVAFGTNVSLPNDVRLMAVECLKMLQPFGKTLYDATNFYTDFLNQQESSISVNELCDRVLTEFTRRADNGEASKGHLYMIQDTVRRLRAVFGDRHIKTLDGNEIKSWLASTDLAVKTRNNYFGYIKNIFGRAQEWNLIDKDIFAKVEIFRNPMGNGLRVEILTPEQLMAFLRSVDKDFVPFFALNAFTGLRRQEIERLDWSEIKLNRNVIDLPATKSKNHHRKLIEIPANLSAWLKPFEQSEGSVKPHKKVQTAMETAAKKAGITKWPKNGLRHSFCSYAVTVKGFEWTAEQCDHSVAILKKHYREVVDRESAEQYWQIRPSVQSSIRSKIF